MAQVALISGLKIGPQYKVFERIIAKYDKGTATSYEALRAKISRHAAQPMILEELTKLRPMTNARLHVTVDNRSPKTKKIAELEAIVANISTKSSTRFQKTGKACFNFLKGACSRQDCKFSHAIDQSAEKKWCEFHKSVTHNAKDCRANIGNQPQVAPAAAGMTKKQLVAYVAQLESASLPFTIAMVRHQVLAAAHELRPKDFIMDNAATSHCIKNPILMMEGSMKPCAMNLEGLGSLKTTEAGDVLLKCEGYAPGTACGILKLTGAPCSIKFPANIISEIKLRKHGIIPHLVCIQQGSIVNGSVVGEIYESHYKNQEGKLILKARTNASGLLVACVSPHNELIHKQDTLVAVVTSLTAPTCLEQTAMEHWEEASIKASSQSIDSIYATLEAAVEVDMDQPIPLPDLPKSKLTQAQKLAAIYTMHLRRGHLNFAQCANLCHQDDKEFSKMKCLACELTKPKRVTHDKIASEKSTRRSSVISADWKGPFMRHSVGGFSGYFTIFETYDANVFVRFAIHMSEWCEIWQEFVAFLEAHEGKDKVVAVLLTDNAKVFVDCGKCAEFNRKKGILHRSSPTEEQWANLSERPQATVFKSALASMIHSGFSESFKEFWEFAIACAAFAFNMLPFRERDRPRLDSFRNRAPHSGSDAMRYLHPFGCLCFMKIADQNVRLDFDQKAVACYYLGYDFRKKSFVLLDLSNKRVRWSANVKFCDNVFPARTNNPLTIAAGLAEFGNNMGTNARLTSGIQVPLTFSSNTALPLSQDAIADSAKLDDSEDKHVSGYSRRGFNPSQKALDNIQYSAAVFEAPQEEILFLLTIDESIFPDILTKHQREMRTPPHLNAALNGTDKAIWLAALKKAIIMLTEHKCFGPVTEVRPDSVIAITMVPKIKKSKIDSLAVAADLRPAVRGDQMKKSVHFNDTFAPVVRLETLKMMLVRAVQLNLTPYAGDVPKAFYGEPVDVRGVNVAVPPGYPLQANGDLRPLHLPRLFAEVLRMLPGFPQSSRIFYFKIVAVLISMGWKQSVNDPCLFVHPDHNELVVFHVDDIILAASSIQSANESFGPNGLAKHWPTICFEVLKDALGVAYQIIYSESQRVIFASQSAYALTVLERANMQDCNGTPMPQPSGMIYSKADSEDKVTGDLKLMTQSQYLSTVMAVNWLVVNTRFDMKFAHSKLASFVANPGVVHKKALQHLLRYLKATLDYGVEFRWKKHQIEQVINLRTYTDSSHLDDRDTSHSTICFINVLFGTPISILSKLTKQVGACINHDEQEAVQVAIPAPQVAANIIAVNKSQRDAIWIANTWAEIIKIARENLPPIPILIDSTGAIKLIENPIQHVANKQILHQLRELRERCASGKFYPVKVDTKANLADAGTKQLATIASSKNLLAYLAAPIGMRPDIVDDLPVRLAMAKIWDKWLSASPPATPSFGQGVMLDG